MFQHASKSSPAHPSELLYPLIRSPLMTPDTPKPVSKKPAVTKKGDVNKSAEIRNGGQSFGLP